MFLCYLRAAGLRRAFIDAVPVPLKLAIGGGIGAFIFAIGVFNGGLAVATGIPADPVKLGDLNSATAIVTLGGLAITTLLYARRVKGALLLGILGGTVIAVAVNAMNGGATFKDLPGVAVMPASPFATPDFSTIGAGLNIQVRMVAGSRPAVVTWRTKVSESL